VNQPAVAVAVGLLLRACGYETDDPSIADTPARVARFWAEFLDGEQDRLGTTFASDKVDQLIVVSGIRVWSLCEHHLLPFSCDLAMGYLSGERVLGLSKFARIAHKYARQLQMQERLVAQIADDLLSRVGENVAVVGAGEHLCATMRGVRTPALMTTSEMRGRFRDDATLRAEFMSLVQNRTEGFR